MISAGDFLKGNTDTSKAPGTTPKGFVSAADFVKSSKTATPAKPTLSFNQKYVNTLNKIGDVAKGFVEPVATTVARPVQAIAEIAGTTPDQVDAVTQKLTGGLVAPVPRDWADAKKDFGREIQTAAFGIPGGTLAKTAIGGAAFGLGSSLEQGNDVLSKDTLIDTAVGAGTGAILHGAGSVLKKTLGKSATKAVEDVTTKEAPVAESAVTETPTTPETPIQEKKPTILTSSKGKLDIPSTMQHLQDQGIPNEKIPNVMAVLSKDTATNNATRYTMDEINQAIEKTTPKMYEPYIPPEQQPTIDFGGKPSPKDTNLPSIQVGAGPKPAVHLPEGMTYAPVETPTAPNPLTKEAPIDTQVVQNSTNTETPVEKQTATKSVTQPGIGLPKDVKGNTISKAAKDVNSNIVSQGFDSLPADEQAHYNSVSRAQQVEDVSNLMSHDIESVKNMVTGKEKIPSHIDPQILYNAMKVYAKQPGETQLLLDLAKSPIATQRSLLAQKLGAAATLAEDSTDPVSIIQEIEKARENPVKLKQATQDVKDAVESSTPKQTTKSLKDFIDSIPDC